jgi:hypothetical protein
MNRQEAIHVETARYVNACVSASAGTNEPDSSTRARRLAHVHALALGRLRGQTVAPWIHESDCPSTCEGGETQ